ncbi:ABC transporter ATP-binding protein [Streptomyces palmae]|uniref:ABC transporter ATP-binding protein n=1 Tax=Streptomyces palmae TaxID=1701085 RepID=UPI001432860C|nr:ABC transporter ATP-binding protein [Streptomyces palmae]
MTEEPPAIRTRGLSKSFGEHQAVCGVDLTVRPGEVFAFLGPNGAGKSTTISMLCTLSRPTAGGATVAGADILTQPHRVRARIGVLFQHSALLPELSLARNLQLRARLHGLSRAQARHRTAHALRLVGLDDRRRDPVRTLSGGLRRRLDIARALLHGPRLLFLDEPTVGLDPPARAELWRHLRTLRTEEGITVFVTTHYLDEAEHCDRLAIIDHGRIAAEDRPDRLKAALGRATIRLRTSDDTKAARTLHEAHGLRPHADPGPDGTLTVPVADTASWLPRLCATLSDRGLQVHSAVATSPTLNDVFFHHTGRHIS